MIKFSEFATDDEKPLDGAKVKIDNILNKSIVLTACKIRNSKFKKDNCDKCATVQFYEATDEKKEAKIFFTGSIVIISMLEKYGEKMPFETVIKKIDKYYSLT